MSGTAGRELALALLEPNEKRTGHRPKTSGADTGYDREEFHQILESREIEPHIAIRDVQRVPTNWRIQRSLGLCNVLPVP